MRGGGGKWHVTWVERAIVAVGAGGVAIVIEHRAFGGIVYIVAGGKRVADFGENSAKTLVSAGEMFDPPLWHARQSCSFAPRSKRRGAGRVVRCMAGRGMQICPTVE